MLLACRSVRYEHGSCRSTAGAPLLIIAAAIGVVVLVAVIVVTVMLRFLITILQLISGSNIKHNWFWSSTFLFTGKRDPRENLCVLRLNEHFINTIVMARGGQWITND